MNDHQDEDVMGFMVELTDDEIRTLNYAVNEAIRVWPGSPARPAEEQEMLQSLRDTFFRMILEMSFDQGKTRGEGEA